MYPNKSLLTRALVLSAGAALSGCSGIVMKPHGDIAQQQAQLIVTSTLLMLLIIVPVIALTLLFAYRYRQSNTDATYAPDWDHSTRLELIIWGAPLLIIIALGAITWITTHKLDPFRPLDRIAEGRPVPADVKPLEVYAVSMDWKWLFIYPEQGIATVNELAAPVDRPIHFRFTSTSVMNTFYVPALAGMIYTMPGMQTQLHAVINKPGVYDGLSAQYSGAGFSDMRFKFHGLSDEEFARWVDGNRIGGAALTRAGYLKLEQPSAKEPIQRFASVEPGLWSAIVDRCVDDRKMCSSQMMAIDAAGGAGKGGLAGTMRSAWRDAEGRNRERTVVAALCTPTNLLGLPAEAGTPAAQN
ncbi:MAG: ubiquinol oxidase subunit II [Rubrivivax sp.]|nr:MAG: ubiquinol oxidase subunit II [Rubrivivax sp.]